MKPILFLLVCMLTVALSAKGQLAIIRDPDGFTNVRAGKSANTKIIGKLYDGDVFFYTYAKNDEWATIFYHPNESSDSGYLQGYIHKDRLLPIEDLPHLSENSKYRIQQDDHLAMHNDTLAAELHTAPFRANQHKLRKDSNGLIQKIDGRQPVGSDGDMPHEKLTVFRMTIAGDTINIPASAWNDVYEPTLETCNVFFDSRTGFIYLYIPASSDGAGAYTIAWIIKSRKYVKRYVDGF